VLDGKLESAAMPLEDGRITDETERSTAAQALRESEERYRRLFEAAPLPIFLFDVESGRYLAVNEAVVAKYGWTRDEFLNMTVFDIRPPEDVPRLKETLSNLDEVSAQRAGLWRHRIRSGKIVDVEITTQNVEFGGKKARLAIAADVTERLRLEERLRQSQKMEATGLLAGGVAHDFNNLLGIILGAVELGRRATKASEPVEGYLGEIDAAARRAAELTRKLLAFSRKQVLQVRALDLNAAIGDFLGILRRVVGEDVELVVRCTPEPLVVNADVFQLEQVLLNLCTNARQATPAGGTIVIETSRRRVDEATAAREAWAAPGDFAQVSFVDTGCGMNAETHARIFEPFFTTKTDGTGLGLAMVHGIVHQHQGHVHVTSQPGQGTTVRILFPITASGLEECLPTPSSESAEERVGQETILIAEDEERLRVLLARSLEHLGYRVLVAQDGEQAASLFQQHHGSVSLAILDVVMPGLGGVQAFERMRAHDPSVKVIFMTGYAPDSAQLGALASQEGRAVLTKPFDLGDLSGEVRRALDAPAHARKAAGCQEGQSTRSSRNRLSPDLPSAKDGAALVPVVVPAEGPLVARVGGFEFWSGRVDFCR
jgi:PAS domain S-box-containing protein